MLEQVIDRIKGLRKLSGQEAQMRVCMMGPRAVGKTSVLTAVFAETQDTIANTRLKMGASDITAATLHERKNELSGMFERHEQPNAGIAATSNVQVFDFDFGIFGKESRVQLNITDFPGEYVKRDPQTVIEYIKESSAIFIAVDTPYLMEENGRYAQKNAIEEVTSFFLKATDEIVDEKMILFIPLKCEKYFYEHRMDEVNEAVQTSYKTLIDFLRKKNVLCAITPILTVGGIEFDRFVNSEEIAGTKSADTMDVISMFKYRKDGEYKPIYCVQPIYYLLSFVAAQYQREKKRKNILQRMISGIYEMFENEQEFIEEVLKLNRFVKRSEDGYQILIGKELLK